MISAFEEYRHIDIPSSALSETINFIQESLSNNKEQALLYMQHETPIGSARFKVNEKYLYFSRFSVCPEEQGKGFTFHGKLIPSQGAKKQQRNPIQISLLLYIFYACTACFAISFPQ